MKFVYPNTISTFTGDRDIALEAGYVEVSNKDYADLIETKKMWQDGEIVDDPTYPERKEQEEKEAEERAKRQAIIDEVNALKKNLFDTDYQAIKHSEGWISDEDYAPIKAQRQAWRDRINELENI